MEWSDPFVVGVRVVGKPLLPFAWLGTGPPLHRWEWWERRRSLFCFRTRDRQDLPGDPRGTEKPAGPTVRPSLNR